MKRRGTEAEVVKVSVVPAAEPSRMITLVDPSTRSLAGVKNAFVRIRPPPDHPPDQTASWRQAAASAGALAVRVLPTPTSSDVAPKVEDDEPVGDVREEVQKLAELAGDEDVKSMVDRVLSEIGSGR